ncbi:hypothetical protein R1sor_001729 [Riccia sorocarpa]|uniref:CCHC-type domain-containing protein n=1 Tax=Riccia sorocarpa TaxID=122646 RepID=A0ABD3GZW7_9MARC
MIYTTPWEPGFDMKRVLAKRMAVAGTTDSADGKFANIRGCIVMDMTKLLPSALRLHMNKETRIVKIRYDTLPDACFKCQERGHIARNCPKTPTGNQHGSDPPEHNNQNDGFIPVRGKGGQRSPPAEANAANAASLPQSNPFDALANQPDQADLTEIGQSSGANAAQAPIDPGSGTANDQTLPDLNVTPHPSQLSSQQKLERKLRKKQRKLEKRLAAQNSNPVQGVRTQGGGSDNED